MTKLIITVVASLMTATAFSGTVALMESANPQQSSYVA